MKIGKQKNRITHIIGIMLMALSAILVMPFSYARVDAQDGYAGLPSAYTQVEYIESTGTQYINTGVQWTATSGFEVEIRNQASMTTSTDNLTYLLGASTASATNRISICNWGTTTGEFHVGSADHAAYLYVNGVQTISYRDGVYATRTYSDSYANEAVAANFYLFALNDNGTVNSHMAKMRLYSCKIYSSGSTLVRDFVPAVRKSDNAVGLYDKVGKTFYTNAGTGTFNKGAVVYPQPTGTDATAISDGLRSVPSIYTQVEYLESTGTQMISTGYYPNQDTRVVLDLSDFDRGEYDGYHYLYGACSAWNSAMFSFGTLHAAGHYQYGYDTVVTTSGTYLQNTDRHTIDQSGDGLYFDGEKIYNFTSSTFTSSHNPLLLFNGYTPSNNYYSIFKLYSFRIYDNGTLVRDYVPVVNNSTGEAGLYDLVNRTFVGNSGTGTFAYGRKVTLPTQYKQVEYIESHGSGMNDGAYINSGVTVTQTLECEVDAQIVSGVQFSAILGIDNFGQGLSIFYYNGNIRINPTNNVNISYDNNRKFYQISSSIISVDGSYVADRTTISSLPYKPVSLFAMTWNSENKYCGISARIYACRFIDNGVVLRNYIPCIDTATGYAGLYDTVTDTFYYATNNPLGITAPGIDLNTYKVAEYLTNYNDSENGAVNGFQTNITWDTLKSVVFTLEYSNKDAIILTSDYSGSDHFNIPSLGFSTADGVYQKEYGWTALPAVYTGDVDAYAYATFFQSGDVHIASWSDITSTRNKAVTFGGWLTGGGHTANYYRLTLYGTGGTVLADYIPVTNVQTGISGMYDLVSGNLATRIGSGKMTTSDSSVIPSLPAGASSWADVYNYEVDDTTHDVTITGLRSAYVGTTELYIPKTIGGNDIKYIADNAFAGNTAITSMAIQTIGVQTLATIGASAFDGCTNLAYLNIPATVTSVGARAFAECISLQTLVDDATSATYGTDYNKHTPAWWEGAYDYTGTTRLVITGLAEGYEDETDIYIPTSIDGYTVMGIGNEAFKDNLAIQTVTFPSTSLIDSIGDRAFYNARHLTSVTFPATVTNYGTDYMYGTAIWWSGVYTTSLNSNNKIIITGLNSDYATLTSLYIPEQINGVDVVEIAAKAFVDNTYITEVEISATLVTINGWGGAGAFWGASNLETVTFAPNSNLTTITTYAFRGCGKLSSINLEDTKITSIPANFANWAGFTSITIPASVTSIGANAFEGCSKLTTVNFETGSQLTTLGDSVFYNCTALTSITIPASVTNLGDSCFRGCTKLETVTFANNNVLTTIGANSFYGCSKLVDINLEDTQITSIQTRTFSSCTSLASITIPATVKSTGDWVFEFSKVSTVTFATGSQLTKIGPGFVKNTQLASINLEECTHLTTIDVQAFYGCTSLTSITIPASVTTIGQQGFKSCTLLTSITIPASVTTIGANAFDSCTKLTTVNFESGSHLTNIGQRAFNICTKIANINLEECTSLTSIEGAAFYGCTSLTSITIPASVEYFGVYTVGSGSTATYEGAFEGCTALTTFTFTSESHLTSIGRECFYGCSALQSMNLENCTHLTTIGQEAFNSAFANSGDSSLTIPASVTSVGNSAFIMCKVRTITFEDGCNATLGTKVFNSMGRLTTLTLPVEMNINKANMFAGDSALQHIYTYNDDVRTISGAIQDVIFQYCAALNFTESKIVFSNVTSIGGTAFKSCALLTDDDIDLSGVTRIENDVFNGCTRMHFTTLDWSSLTSIGKSAFQGCTGITGTIDLSSTSITSLASDTFNGCTNLTGMVLPNGLTSLGGNNFKLTGITTLTVPAGLTTIGDDAFRDMYKLTYIYLPSGVTSISTTAFAGGSRTSGNADVLVVEMPASVATLGSNLMGLNGNRDKIVVYGTVENGAPILSYSGIRKIVPRTDYELYSGTVTPYPLRVTFVLNGGSGTEYIDIPKEKVVFGLNYETSPVPNPTKGDDTFVGWYSDGVLTQAFDFTEVDYLYSDTILYARWQNMDSLTGDWNLAYTYTLDGTNATITGIATNYQDLPGYYIPRAIGANSEYVVVAVAQRAFYRARNAQYFDFADDSECVEIGNSAMAMCSQLERVTLPSCLETIGDAVWYGSARFNTFSITDSANYKTVNGLLYNASGSELIIVPYGVSSVRLADTCTTVLGHAFEGMPNLSSVDLHNVVTISANSFVDCGNLVSVIIPNLVIEIPDNAFNNCNELVSFVIQGNLATNRTQIPTIGRLMVPSSLQGVLNVYVPNSNLANYVASNWSLYNLLTYADADFVTVHTVTFDYAGGSGGISSIIVANNSTIPVILPSRLGYNFDGWYYMDGEDEIDFDIATLITQDYDLIAAWDALRYNIIYYLNGGSYDNTTPETVTVQYTLDDFGVNYDIDIPVIVTTRTGYDFVAWFTNAEFDSARVTAIRYSDLTLAQVQGLADIQLYAKWEIIHFDITLPQSDNFAISLDAGSSVSTEWGGSFTFTITYAYGYTQNSHNNVVVKAVDSDEQASTLVATVTEGIAWYTLADVYREYTIVLENVLINTYNVYFRSGSRGISAVENLQSRVAVNHGDSVYSTLGGGVSSPRAVGYTFVSYKQVDMVEGEEVINASAYNFDSAVTEDVIVVATWDLVYYEITYYLNGGKLGSSSATQFTTNYSIEDTVMLPINTSLTYNVTRTGYEFAGWWEDAELINDIYDFDGATLVISFGPGEYGNKEYVAKWAIQEYNITYHTNNGEISGEYPLTYTIADTVALPIPTRTGYTFDAWYTDALFSGNVLRVIAQGSTGNVTVYAKWNVNTYSIVYHLGGTSLSPVTIMGNTISPTINVYNDNYTYDSANAITLVSEVSRKGYTFAGWYESQEPSDVNRIYTLNAGATGDREFYARWNDVTYTIALDYGSAYTGVIDVNEIQFTLAQLENAGGSISLPTPGQSGYFFSGWYTGNVLVLDINTTNYNSFVTLVARWSNESFELTTSGTNVDKVRLLAASNSTLTPVMGGTIKFVVDFVDTTYNRSTLALSYRMGSSENYVVLELGADGYYTIADITGNIDVRIDGIVLNIYTITFEPNGGTEVDGTTVVYGGTVTRPTNPTRTGYTFDCWCSDIRLTTEFNFDNAITYDMILYARWTATVYNFTITNNITSASINGTYSADDLVVFGDNHKFDIPAYTFVRFTLGGNPIDSTSGRVGNLAIVAEYVTTEYSIAYTVDHGESNNLRESYTVIDSTFALNSASKSGYTFSGWRLYDNNDGHIHLIESGGVYSIVTGSYGDIILIAEFTINSAYYYDLTFKVDGLTLTNRSVLKTSGMFTESVDPGEREGYEFLGWYAQNDDEPFDFEHTVIDDNMTFNAVYEVTSHDIVYNFSGLTGVVNDDNITRITYSTEPYVLNDASKLGYAFGGWYTDALYTNRVYNLSRVTDTVVLYGKFTLVNYTITYFLNEGTNSEYNPTEYNVLSETITLVDATRVSYDFLGWFDADNHLVTTIEPTDCTNYTIYARWQMQDLYRQVRYFYGNELIETEIHNKGQVFDLYTAPSKEGLDFDCWCVDSELTTPYEAEALEENLDLWAKYDAIEYTITYTANKEGDVQNPNAGVTSFTVLDNVVVLQPASLDSYDFVGWYYGGARVSTIPLVPNNIVLEAQFTPTVYNIDYYDKTGERISMDVTTYTVEGPIVLANPTKTYYRFNRWEYNGEVITNTTELTGDITVFADFTPIEYAITYMFNNRVGTATHTNIASLTIETLYELTPATAPGYNFVRWKYNGDDITTIENMAGNVVIEGVFELKTFTLTYVVENDYEQTNPATYNVEMRNIVLRDPYAPGRIFNGWQVNGEYVATIDTSLVSDLTVVAVFEPIVVQSNVDIEGILIAVAVVLAIAGLGTIIIMGRTIHKLKYRSRGDVEHMQDLLDRMENKQRNDINNANNYRSDDTHNDYRP